MGHKSPVKLYGHMSHVKRSTKYGTSFFIEKNIFLSQNAQQKFVKNLDH